MHSGYSFKMSSTSIFTVFALTVVFYPATFAAARKGGSAAPSLHDPPPPPPLTTGDLLPSTQICGLQSTNDYGTETVAGLGEFPWSALLEFQIDGKTDAIFSCVGTLISNKYVVTSGNCIKGLPSIMKLVNVRLGVNNITDCPKENPKCSDGSVNIGVDKIIVHKDYGKNKDLYNDIALIKLNSLVTFSDYIKPICVPRSSTVFSNKYEESVMSLAGWGRTSNDTSTNIKKKIKAIGKPTQECNSVYSRLGINVLNDSQLCALTTNGFCSGSIGNSLPIQNDGNWYMYGIASIGPAECSSKHPTVYTRVSSLAQWIIDNLEE